MRTDREGREDTRCCDMKPGTRIFFAAPQYSGDSWWGKRGPFVKQNWSDAEES